MLSVLAIKNNVPDAALEILAVVDKERSISIRCLKILALMGLKNYLQIIPVLRHAIEHDGASGQRYFFFADVVRIVKVYCHVTLSNSFWYQCCENLNSVEETIFYYLTEHLNISTHFLVTDI